MKNQLDERHFALHLALPAWSLFAPTSLCLDLPLSTGVTLESAPISSHPFKGSLVPFGFSCDAHFGPMRPLSTECPHPSSGRLSVTTMTSCSLYPVSASCEQPETCKLNSCQTTVPKLPKVDSSFCLNSSLGNNYNFYARHLHQGTSLPSKSPYNVSTYWLYSFASPTGPQTNSNLLKFGAFSWCLDYAL